MRFYAFYLVFPSFRAIWNGTSNSVRPPIVSFDPIVQIKSSTIFTECWVLRVDRKLFSI